MDLFEEGNGSYKLPGGNPHLAFGLREVPCTDVVTEILLYFVGLCLLYASHMRILVEKKKVQAPNDANIADMGAMLGVARPKEGLDCSLTDTLFSKPSTHSLLPPKVALSMARSLCGHFYMINWTCNSD